MIFNCKTCKSGQLKVDSTYPYHDIYECENCKKIFQAGIDTCCRDSFEIVTIKWYDHSRYTLYHQCQNCGGADKTRHLKKKEYSDQIKGTFNEDRFEQWKAIRNEESNQIYQGLSFANYKNTTKYKYHQYLFSEQWKDKRKLVLIRENNLCQSCKMESAVDIHHLNYDNLFNEPLEDLQAVCRDCHLIIHNIPKF